MPVSMTVSPCRAPNSGNPSSTCGRPCPSICGFIVNLLLIPVLGTLVRPMVLTLCLLATVRVVRQGL